MTRMQVWKNALGLMKRKPLGYVGEKKVYSNRSYRAALLVLIAGNRTVLLNANVSGFTLNVDKPTIIVGTHINTLKVPK